MENTFLKNLQDKEGWRGGKRIRPIGKEVDEGVGVVLKVVVRCSMYWARMSIYGFSKKLLIHLTKRENWQGSENCQKDENCQRSDEL